LDGLASPSHLALYLDKSSGVRVGYSLPHSHDQRGQPAAASHWNSPDAEVSGVRSRPALVVGAAAVLVVGVLVAPVSVSGVLPSAVAAGPVSGAIGLGGGLSGSVDERTGLFSVSVPVVSVGGPGSAGVSWSLVWDQGRAAGGLDRSGFGPGWSLGVSFIDAVNPLTVYPANGGAYVAGGSFPSGLRDYPQQDLVFKESSGSATPFTLSYDDGRVDSFNRDGNLVSRTDRFGNRTQLTWEHPSWDPAGWAPVSIVDGYGQTTTFTYSSSSVVCGPGVSSCVVVSAPPRSDGVVAKTTIGLDGNHRVTSVTDPTGAVSSFGYSGVSLPLLTSVGSPSQAHTLITYQEVNSPPGLTAVHSVVTVDASGKVLGPAQLFSLNPTPPNVDQHNYTGYPTHVGATTDALFESGDRTYFYWTLLASCVVTQPQVPETCPGSPSSTLSEYDSQHRLVSRIVKGLGGVQVQSQSATYLPVTGLGDVAPNYARPMKSTVTYSAATSVAGTRAAGGRTVSTGRVYDSHGRVTSSTDEAGTTTATTYDGVFGLITGVTITGADGARSQTTNVLSADHKTIHSATTAYAAAGQPLTARSTTTYLYDTSGQPTQRTMTWAPGAKPAGDSGGPDTVTTTFASSVDVAAHTRTITTTTAAGTTAAAATSTVLDLVTMQPVRTTDPLGRVTSYRYDAGGRQTSKTTPDGLTTTTGYTAAAAATSTSPATLATRTVSTSDGRVVLTSYDALDRAVRVTDNVANEAFTASATTRQLSAYSYSLNGATTTATDQAGRTVTTTLDVLGRQVQEVDPTGITHATAYNDVAHTITQQVDPAGSTSPAATRTTSYDNGNQPVTVARQYSDGTTDPTQTSGYDGLGRVTSQTSNDLTMNYTYLGAGGASLAQTATPQTSAFPGTALNLSDTVALGGQQTSSARAQSAQNAAQGTRLSYDPAGRTATATDPDGRTTSYTYHADGTVATRTTPSGTVTTDTYNPTTGQLTSVTAKPATGPAITTSYSYVPAGQPGAGHVHTISDGTTTVTLGYDADAHVITRSYSDGTTTAAHYTDTGLLDTTTDVTGAVTTYRYDTAGRMASATQTRGGTVLASETYSYDAMSRVGTITRGNGVTTTNTWTGHNQLATQRTTTASGALIEAHTYTYDTHNNLATRIDTGPADSATTTSAGTWTTTYRYDAYNRLLASATYAGPNTAGQPATATSYTINTAGDVTGITTTTRPQNGAQQQSPANTGKPKKPKKNPRPGATPPPFTTTTSNTIDPAGQLTAQTSNGATTTQTFDTDGRVTHTLTGTAISYDPLDRMLTATHNGTTTAYSYWPDGTPRATTTTGSGGASSQTFHYGTDGTLTNDTTTDPTTGATTTTASYLLTAGREARTLQPGTTTTGTVPTTGTPAPVTTGTGTGYLLRDRHSSVTALIDTTTTVTNTYHYSDYGTPTQPNGQPAPSSSPALGGRANPFQYTGATPVSSRTDLTTGLLLLPARNYDPTQNRFTSRDTANVFNHYQAFSTNPITLTDTTGHFSLEDLLIDIGSVILFAVIAVATAGVAIPAVIGTEVAVATASELAFTAATAITAVASATGAVASTVKMADDIDDAVTGKHFLTNDQRSALSTVQTVAGAVAAIAGLGAGAASAVEAGDQMISDTIEAANDAADFVADSEDEISQDATSSSDSANQANWNNPNLKPGEEISDYWDVAERVPKGGTRSFAETVGRSGSGSGSEEIFDGLSGSVGKPQSVIPTVDDSIPPDQDVLQKVVGQTKLNSSDAAIFRDDDGLSNSFSADEAASDSEEETFDRAVRASAAPPTRTAMDGNVQAEGSTFSSGPNDVSDPVAAMLARDDNWTFAMFRPY
jgi:RHS repeat-associated protein